MFFSQELVTFLVEERMKSCQSFPSLASEIGASKHTKILCQSPLGDKQYEKWQFNWFMSDYIFVTVY